MNMLFRNLSITDLTHILKQHANQSPAPHLVDPKAIVRARRWAKKSGIWEDLNQNLNPKADISVIKRSAYRNFERIGDRQMPQAARFKREKERDRAALALWLGHPKADVDYLQDVLWACCDDWTWVAAAHEYLKIDLWAMMWGVSFAEILYTVGDQLESEVKDRVQSEIYRRIIEPFWDYKEPLPWKTQGNNWNHVCNGCLIRIALLLIDNPEVLAHTIHGAITNMTYGLDGFSDDGGCAEGAGYWDYGFGNYMLAAHALYKKTNGEINLMEDEKIKRICQYPLIAQISGHMRSTFSDSGHGYVGSQQALLINEFFDMPEIYGACLLRPDGSLQLHERNPGNAIRLHELALYKGQKAKASHDPKDYVLPDLGQVKLRGKPGKNQMTLMAIAGHNSMPHNHNDIGSFIVHQNGSLHLTDPGAPQYSKKTFGPHRYEIPYCNSFGHSVPVINNKLQGTGKQYAGILRVENINGTGKKRAEIDMTRAYSRGTVKALIRTFTLDTEANKLTLNDAYTFTRKPKAVEEAFITFEKVTVAANKQSVQIGSKTKGIKLTAIHTPGIFQVARLEEAAKEYGKQQVISRISFVPKKLEKEMHLQFEIG